PCPHPHAPVKPGYDILIFIEPGQIGGGEARQNAALHDTIFLGHEIGPFTKTPAITIRLGPRQFAGAPQNAPPHRGLGQQAVNEQTIGHYLTGISSPSAEASASPPASPEVSSSAATETTFSA